MRRAPPPVLAIDSGSPEVVGSSVCFPTIEWTVSNKGKKDNKITVEPTSFEASEPEKERALYYKQEKQTKLSAVLKKINVVVSEER